MDRTEFGELGYRSQATFDAPGLVVDLRQMITDLEGRGLRVNPTSRVPKYVAEIIDCLQRPRPLKDPEAERFGSAMVEGQLLLDVYRGLSTPPEVPNWESHFGLALDGHLELTGEDKSRNKLLELLIAALARKSGLNARLEEPDVVIGDDTWELVVAAKRIGKIDRLQKRVRYGTEQIEKWGRGIHGFVVVDLTFALGLHRPAELEKEEDLRRLAGAVRDKISASLPDGVIDKWLSDRPHSVGIVGFAYCAARIREGGILKVLRFWYQRPSPTAAARDPLLQFMGLPTKIKVT